MYKIFSSLALCVMLSAAFAEKSPIREVQLSKQAMSAYRAKEAADAKFRDMSEYDSNTLCFGLGLNVKETSVFGDKLQVRCSGKHMKTPSDPIKRINPIYLKGKTLKNGKNDCKAKCKKKNKVFLNFTLSETIQMSLDPKVKDRETKGALWCICGDKPENYDVLIKKREEFIAKEEKARAAFIAEEKKEKDKK